MFLIHFYTCIDNLSLSPGFYQVAKLTMPLHSGAYVVTITDARFRVQPSGAKSMELSIEMEALPF
ncbi:MAG: hypothetical protein HamCj_03020 [Candidatus Hamiltonella defensa (Ceratovacuna japonica)]